MKVTKCEVEENQGISACEVVCDLWCRPKCLGDESLRVQFWEMDHEVEITPPPK